jgi:hypothetical protein
MRVGIINFGIDGNFDVAHKTWGFFSEFESDVVFSIGQGITTEQNIKEKFPNSIFNRNLSLTGSDSEKNVKLIKEGFLLLNGDYDFIILNKINNYVIADDGYDFLKNSDDQDAISGYRPIKIIGKQLFFVPDNFFIGTYANMKTLINNLPDNVETDINDVIPKTLLNNELYIKDIGPFFTIEEVFDNIPNGYQNLAPHELRIKAKEWKERKTNI